MKIVYPDDIEEFLFKGSWEEHLKNIPENIKQKFMWTTDSSWGLPYKGFGKCEKYGYFICVPTDDEMSVNIIWAEKGI